MIARIWRGTTAEDRADDYVQYLRGTGLADYTSTSGNHGVSMLIRRHDGRADFTLISYWESMEHVKAFAGDDPEVAVFYPEDDDYLIDRETTVTHHEVVEPGPRMRVEQA
jgi:heme-degrading monooxygenase HmoA